MTRRPVFTDEAPVPTGPFSQAIIVGDLVFTAGQAGRNRDTGVMGDLADQTYWALKNLDAILRSADSSLASAVKLTIYLREDADVTDLNEVYKTLVPEPRPARSLVMVRRLKGPQMLVEIEAVGCRSDGVGPPAP
jgi:2-iminobutanoate/2-iminopropanoate deaminase